MKRQPACRALRFGCALAALCAAVTASVAFGAEPAADLPLRSGGSFDLWRTALKGILAAVFCLALLVAVLYVWRHRIRLPGAVAPLTAAAAQIEWARRASPRTTLLVVRWQGRRYLLAETGSTAQLLDSQAVEEPRT